VFLILFGIVSIMKLKIIAVCCVFALSACSTAPSDKKSGWFFGMIPPLEWPKRHWKAQDFQPSIQPEDAVLSASVDRNKTLFGNAQGLSPEEYIANLKKADIVRSVKNLRTGMFKQTLTNDIVIELGPNFYTLSYSDQVVITELLAKSYNQDTYMLKDWKTKKLVGQITPDGFLMF